LGAGIVARVASKSQRPRDEHGRFLPNRRTHEKHEPADVDAMGLDKRREVVGQSYGPSVDRQAAIYGIFLAVLAALVIGGKLLADELDRPPAEVKDQAAWTGNDIAPTDIDFRSSGDVSSGTAAP
jgi:hypothetical protein